MSKGLPIDGLATTDPIATPATTGTLEEDRPAGAVDGRVEGRAHNRAPIPGSRGRRGEGRGSISCAHWYEERRRPRFHDNVSRGIRISARRYSA